MRRVEGGDAIMEADSLVMRKQLIDNFTYADSCHGEFTKAWRMSISFVHGLENVPFSILQRYFLDRCGSIIQGGEPLPQNSSRHDDDDDNNNNNNVPFSILQRFFLDRHGLIIQGSEPLLPQNSSRHHENNHHELEDDRNNNPDLDLDSIKEILKRLPMPSLIRAKSICKTWETAISGTSWSSIEGTHHFITQQVSHGSIAFLCPTLNQWFSIPTVWDQKKRQLLCAADKGLFLFVQEGDKPVISNPLTKQHRYLPKHRYLPNFKGWDLLETPVELMVEGGHFEIIAISNFSNVELYDSRTDKWRTIPHRANFWANGVPKHCWTSTLCNGMAYFTNTFGRFLGCYDFTRREFQYREIEGGLPPQIDGFDDLNNGLDSLPSLVACNGKLFLVGRLEKEARGGGEFIWGGFPFIGHTLVGIWELENNDRWSLISVTPEDLLENTVKSSHGTDFLVAASLDKIWLTIKGSMNVLTLSLMSMEWSVLPGHTADDIVDPYRRWARRAFCLPFSFTPL